LFRALFSF